MFGKKKKRQVLRIEKGQWAQIWESFKQNKLAMISMVVLLLIVLGSPERRSVYGLSDKGTGTEPVGTTAEPLSNPLVWN